jgi:hypothetical protein
MLLSGVVHQVLIEPMRRMVLSERLYLAVLELHVWREVVCLWRVHKWV